ncbi:MAG TPA: outer membrane beta-barrel family protein, partial [Flavisolibacter sp.]|nr:outer membrane beta-barrel family protein [Flavisolibacter sp.]
MPTGVTDRILVVNNSTDAKRNNVNANLNYSYNGINGKSLVLNADHGYYDIKTDQHQPNTYYDPSGQHVINEVDYEMIAPTKINISSIKADYEQNLGKGKLGFGGKLAYINADNDFQRYNVYNGVKDLDKDRSNSFNYKENINALYVNYNRSFKGVILQAGLRAENTNTKGTSAGLKNTGSAYEKYDSTFKRNYTDLFPSAAITFNKNPMSQFSLTYSRRIDRPAYQDLNPFEFKLDEYTYQKGNIDLRPQYTNSFGITHTFKYRLNTTLNYSHVKDMFAQIGDTIDVSKAFVTKRNLAQQDIISLNVSYPFSYKSYSVFANLNTFYSKYKPDLRKNPNET